MVGRLTPPPAASMRTRLQADGLGSDALARSLLALADAAGAERITAAELIGALGNDGPVALVLLFALPNVIPMPPGTSAVLGAPLLRLSLQMTFGTQAWLPASVGRLSLPRRELAPWLRRTARWLEGRGMPDGRAPFISTGATRLAGALCSLLAVLVLLPIPFGNMAPAFAISLCALGILRRDAKWLLAGLATGAVTIALLGKGLYLVAQIGLALLGRSG